MYRKKDQGEYLTMPNNEFFIVNNVEMLHKSKGHCSQFLYRSCSICNQDHEIEMMWFTILDKDTDDPKFCLVAAVTCEKSPKLMTIQLKPIFLNEPSGELTE